MCQDFYSYAHNQEKTQFCSIGKHKRLKPPTYFLTGDSISLHYLPAFEVNDGSGLFASIGSGCPATLVTRDSKLYESKTPQGFQCQLLHKKVFNYIKNSNEIKKLFISGSWVHKSKHPDFFSNLAYAVEQYALINVSVTLIQQPPVQIHDPNRLYKILRDSGQLTDQVLRNKSISRVAHLKANEKYEPFYYFKRLCKEKNIGYIQTFEWLCDSDCCPIGTVNESYYRDIVHIRFNRSLSLTPLFKNYIDG
jgi:hypothetical protein